MGNENVVPMCNGIFSALHKSELMSFAKKKKKKKKKKRMGMGSIKKLKKN
jgi:hypothetical protein